MPTRFFKRRRRREKRRTGVETLCGVIVTAVIVSLYSTNIFKSLDLSICDYLMRWRPLIPGSPEIAIIELGQESIETIKKWPVPRDVYTRLLNILNSAGASAVGFNVMFMEESDPSLDKKFADVIKAAGMVYLPYYIEILPGGYGYSRIVDNLQLFKRAARAEGHINMPPDMDGVVRRVLLNIPLEGVNHWQISFLMACDMLGVDVNGIETKDNSMRLKTKNGDIISIPVDEKEGMLIDWNGPWRKVFQHYTLADVFESEEALKDGKYPRVPPESFRGKICLVGLTAPGTFDAMHTPLEQLVPSIGIHATIISQILQRRFVDAKSKPFNILIILALGILASFLFPHLKPLAGFVTIIILGVVYLAISLVLFFKYNTQVSILYPMGSVFLSYIAMSIHHEIVISIERARLHHLATRDSLTDLYVIGHFRLLLNAEMSESQRLSAPLAIIMTDIDHFKEFNDTYGHQTGDFILKETAKILTSTCRELDIVGRYGGEEFIVLLPDTSLKNAREVAQRIRKRVESHVYAKDGQKYKVTLSLGVAELDPLDSADNLIKRADEALYEAKSKGRNLVCVKAASKKDKKIITLS